MHVEFLTITILLTLILSRWVQHTYKIPKPLTLTILGLAVIHFLGITIPVTTMVICVLPLLLISDAMLLNLVDLKKERWLVFYYAVVAVMVGTGILTIAMYFATPDYLPLELLFAIAIASMATDAVAVSATVKNFSSIPHRITGVVEAESLFNDPTAMIIFMLLAIPFATGGTITLQHVVSASFLTIAGAIVLGGLVGWLGAWALSKFEDASDELLITLATAYGAFACAEIIKVSSILTIIVAIITLKTLIEINFNVFENDETEPTKKTFITDRMSRKLISRSNFEFNHKVMETISLIAIAIVFIAFGTIVDFELMYDNWQIITTFFVVGMIIRFGLIAIRNAFPSDKDDKLTPLDVWFITFGGVRGGLSLVLINFLPDSVIWKDLALTIMLGIVILSILIQIPVLLYLASKYDKTAMPS